MVLCTGVEYLTKLLQVILTEPALYYAHIVAKAMLVLSKIRATTQNLLFILRKWRGYSLRDCFCTKTVYKNLYTQGVPPEVAASEQWSVWSVW